MQRVNGKVIDDYVSLLKQLPHVIEAYGLKKMVLAKQVKIPYNTFARKLKDQSFTPDEAKKIVNYINRD